MSPELTVSILVFYISLVTGIFLIYLFKHKNLASNQNSDNTQIAKAGGFPIILSFFIGSMFFANKLALEIFIASIPIIIGGFLKDSSKNINRGLMFALTLLSSAIFILTTGYMITNLGFAPLNNLSFPVAFVFSVFFVSGVTNSFNTLKNFRGLMSGFTIIILIIFAILSYQIHDEVIFKITITLLAATFAFFFLDFPFGRIQLGAGGTYFIGFVLSELCVLTISRQPHISFAFCFALLIYPIWEMLFYFYRKKILKEMTAMFPYEIYFHSVTYKAITHSNLLTCIFIFLFILPFELLTFFAKYRTSLSLLVIFFYILIYDLTYHAFVWRIISHNLDKNSM